MIELRELSLLSIFVRILLSLIIGGLLGIERGRKNMPAGFRTYMLVCLGSSLVMMTNQYVYQYFQTSDPVRMGAQVISGIGFLGAGTIILTGKTQVKGITTAAGLWTAACIGLAIGIGFYEGAVLGGAAIYFVMSLMRKIDAYIHNHSETIDLYIEMEGQHVLSDFIGFCRDKGFDIFDIQLSKNKGIPDQAISVILSAKSHNKLTHTEMVELLSESPGVIYIQEL